jgi:PAS domain S-box-containing protein
VNGPDHPATPAQWVDLPLLELANHDVQFLSAADTVFDAARLLAAHRLSFVPVLDAGRRPLGVVTESRLLAAAHGAQGPEQGITTLMQPALCVPYTLDAAQGFQRCLAEGGAPLLLVDEGGRVVAMVGEGEFRARLQLALLAGRHRVSTVMARVLRPLSPQHTLAQAIDQMRRSTGTAVVVTVDDRAVGVLTSRDVARLIATRAEVETVRLGEIMSRPVLTVPVDATINEGAERMLAGRTRHLVVLDAEQRVVGVLDEHELTRAMAVQVMDAGIEQERLRQRAVLDAIPDLVWLKDPKGVYLTCNPRFEQLFGAGEAHIRGRTDFDFLPREQADAWRRHDELAIRRGAPSIIEEDLSYACDGHRELVQTIKTPVRDANGRLLGVLGVGRDISALRQVEHEYRWLFARNPAPMFIYERSSLALLRVNEAFCREYGYTDARARRLRLTDLHLPEDQETLRQRVPTLHGLVDAGEWRHVRFDGSLLYVVVKSHDIRIDGKDCRVVVLSDVTRLRRDQQRDGQRLALMERLARGDSQESLFEQLLRDHQALYPASLCALQLLDADAGCWRLGAAPSLPLFFNQALDGQAAGPTTAEHIDSHPDWQPWRELAQRAGLRSCWVETVAGHGGRVLGSLAVYRHEPGLPGPEEREHLQFAVQLAAAVITHAGTTRALRNSERRLREILQGIPDLVWMKDSEGVYRSCNAAFARVLGRSPDRIIGLRDADLTEAHIAAACRAEDQRVLRSGQAASSERWMLDRSSGQHLLVELINTPLCDDDGRPLGVLGVARDITQIKQGAVAVAEQQRLIDTMFSQTTDSIVLIDPDPPAIVNFNDAAWLGLGYTREQFARLTPAELRADQDQAQVRQLNERALAGELLSYETRHRRADGGVQDAAVTLRRISYGGRVLLSAVWRDITPGKRHEARIRRLNRSYAVLSAVNEAVVRLRDRSTLCAEVCRITVQSGGFGLAWIGRVEDPGGTVQVLAQAGRSEGFVESLRIQLVEPDGGPIARALASGKGYVVPDIGSEPGMEHRRQALRALEHRSNAVFPILPAGGERLFLVVYSPSTDHFDAEQVALFGRLAQDVAFALEFIATGQAEAEAQHFRAQLIESVAGLFFALEPDGRIVLWNRRLEQVSGHGRAELNGRQVADFFDEPERAQVVRRLREALERGESRVEASLVSRDGARTPCLLVLRRLDRAQGPLLVGTGIDISDRVRSERELAGYRDQLEGLVRQRTAELEAVNARLHREDRRLRAMLGLSQRASRLDEQQLFQQGLDEIIGLTGSRAGCVRCVRDDDSALVLQAWAGSAGPPPDLPPDHPLARGEVWRVDAHAAALADGCSEEMTPALGVPVVDGGRVVLVVCAAGKATPYDDGDLRELQGLAADLWGIVQRRRIEIALGRAKLAADAANLAKSAFLANMSHEIRTPMNAVIGFAHLLRRDPLTPRQQDHLTRITEAGQHLLQVINDILDFSKIEAHKVTLEEADFPLRASLERVRAMQIDAARAKQLPLLLSVDARCPPALRGDRLRLEQVLLNLLSNAVKFTVRGRIELRVSVLAQEPEPLRLRFEVIDTGIGMSDEQQRHVFEAFAQADASTTRRFGGTGLGLAISKRLAQLMNGRIGVDSELGRGSCFWLELPLRRALEPAAALSTARADPAAAAPDRRLSGVQVLVVEDNPINQEVTSALLLSLGVVVELAASGEQALQQFDARRHQLVLMDVQMPGMDGLRATAALRARPDGAAVPIVAMTANAFAEDRAACLAAGMNDYLAKPVEPQALEACLLRWLQAGREPAGVAPSDPPEVLLHRRLQELPELDTAGPLARMRGAWPLYLRTLRMFIGHHVADAGRLADAARAGDVPALRALAHSLVGAAATVGAREVLQRAQDLQRSLASGSAPAAAPWQALGDALLRCCRQVQSTLDGAAEPAAAPDRPRPQPQALRAALAELQPLLAVHDTAALVLFETHRELLEAALGPAARSLGQQIGNFSFGAALATLQAALGGLRDDETRS